ncbi:HD domain-containing protein, partial [Halorubrum tibetense]
MTAIKDSVHGHVRLGPAAVDLIDTPAFQRLRHIKQLSTVRLVYPSANHTRFEHSLGVYHLARQALDGLGLDDETAAHVRAAALLHDVGHGPYGHQTEGIIRRRTGKDHDEVEWLLTDADRELCTVLERHGLDPERVAALVAGDGGVGQLVSGELDVDRMDYLVRDAHHTGVPYGTVDTGRLVNELRLVDDGRERGADDAALVLAEGNVATAESLLVARSLMNAVVYRHHVSRVAGAMLERACERYLDRTDTGVEAFRRLADHDLLVAVRDVVPELGERIERRDLYKRAVWVGLGDVPAGTVDAEHAEELAAEREIADRVGI